MDKIDPEEVAKKYNSLEIIWDEADKWHLWTKKMIDGFIAKSLTIIPQYNLLKILNAGSAGYNYGLSEENVLHVDIAEEKISHLENSLVANIQNLPINDNQFNIIICVGSVINYCEPIPVMKEFSRVLSPKGYLILEFENSYTLELLGKSAFNKKATLIKTFYNGKPEKIWFFSEEYITELAELYGLKLVAICRCHIISPLIYRITKSEKLASRFGVLDKFFSAVPFLKNFSSNTICLFIKK